MIAVTMLTACVTPEPYRFDGEILQPNTRIGAHRAISIDILNVQPKGRSCRLQNFQASDVSANPSGGMIRGHFIHVGFNGIPALRLTFESDYFKKLEAAGNLRGRVRYSIGQWLTASGINECLPRATDESEEPSITDMIARQVYAQRPMTAADAIYSWYGPGAAKPAKESQTITDLKSRVVVLRPGMRVCAQDISEPTSGSPDDDGGDPEIPTYRYGVGGTTCAWVTDGPNGQEFSSSVGRLRDPLTPPWPEDGTTAFKLVTSWDEVQLESDPNGRHLFAIVHAAKLPSLPDPNYDPANGSFLVRIDPEKDVPLQKKYCFDDNQATECRGLDALQFGASDKPRRGLCKADHVACIVFGNRSTFSIEIAVTVNGDRMMLPAAATLASVVGQVAPDFLGPDSGSTSDPSYDTGADRARLLRTVRKIRLQRWFEGRRVNVKLTGESSLNFPLQPGDVIRW